MGFFPVKAVLHLSIVGCDHLHEHYLLTREDSEKHTCNRVRAVASDVSVFRGTYATGTPITGTDVAGALYLLSYDCISSYAMSVDDIRFSWVLSDLI